MEFVSAKLNTHYNMECREYRHIIKSACLPQTTLTDSFDSVANRKTTYEYIVLTGGIRGPRIHIESNYRPADG